MLKSAHNFFCLFHKHVMLHGTKASFVLVIEPKNSAVLYEFATCTAVGTRVSGFVRRCSAREDTLPPTMHEVQSVSCAHAHCCWGC